MAPQSPTQHSAVPTSQQLFSNDDVPPALALALSCIAPPPSPTAGTPLRRVVTARTIGMLPVSDGANKQTTQFVRRKYNLNNSDNFLNSLNGFGDGPEHKSGRKLKPEEIAKQEYDKKLRKFLDIVDDLRRSPEESKNRKVDVKQRQLSGGNTFLTTHAKAMAAQSPSSAGSGHELMRKASRQLAGDVATAKSLADFTVNKVTGSLAMTERVRVGIKKWKLSSNDLTEVQIKERDRQRVLLTWQVRWTQDMNTLLHARAHPSTCTSACFVPVHFCTDQE